MSSEAVRYVLAQNIKPVAIKFYMERVAYRIDNDKGYGWPAQGTIAKELSVSVTTIKKYQAECEKRGILKSVQGKVEKGKFTSNHYEIPGFVEWLAQSDADAVSYFVRAMSAPPQQPGVSTVKACSVATRSVYGPQQPGVSTDRSNPEGLQKERLKEKVKDTPIVPTGDAVCVDLFKEEATSSSKPAKAIPFAEFWSAYPNRKGKAKSEHKWKALSAESQAQALAAIPVYLNEDKCRRGFVKEAEVYLNQRVWEDYEVSGEQAEEDKITAIALDLAEGSPKFILKYGWQTLDEVQRKAVTLFRRGVQKAREEFQWTPPASFANQAA